MADFSLTKLMFPILIPIFVFVFLIPFNVFPSTVMLMSLRKISLI